MIKHLIKKKNTSHHSLCELVENIAGEIWNEDEYLCTETMYTFINVFINI